MNKRRKILLIIGSVLIVILIAGGTLLILLTVSPQKEQSAAVSKDQLAKQADASFAAGVKSENGNKTEDALKSYEDAYVSYQKAGNTEKMAALVLKIQYMKKILEAAGKKVDLTVDTSQQTITTSTSTSPSTDSSATASGPAVNIPAQADGPSDPNLIEKPPVSN
jgi:ABC-type Na+ efflux pump permease subunit